MDGRGLARNTNIAPAHPAFLHEPAGNELRCVAGDGEADALRGQNHRRVHADDLAARIHQRPAGVAGVQRGVGLDDVVHEPARLRTERTAQRADDAGRDSCFEAVRIANRDGQLPDAQPRRICELHGR